MVRALAWRLRPRRPRRKAVDAALSRRSTAASFRARVVDHPPGASTDDTTAGVSRRRDPLYWLRAACLALTRSSWLFPPPSTSAAEGQGCARPCGGQEAGRRRRRQAQQPAAGEGAEELRSVPPATASAGPAVARLLARSAAVAPARGASDAPVASPCPCRHRTGPAAQEAAEPLREVAQVCAHPAPAPGPHKALEGAPPLPLHARAPAAVPTWLTRRA